MIKEITQRKYDNKWVEWTLMPDPTQSIKDPEWKGREVFFPLRYVQTKVYEFLGDIENE